MDRLILDAALISRLETAMTRNGVTDAADIEWLTEGDNIAQVRQIRLGQVTRKHAIDCDAGPFVPTGWFVKEHQKGGLLKWDATKVELYLDEGQEGGGSIEGTKLREALARKPVLNANVLDYLLTKPHLIPIEWKNKVIFFWGTIYSDSFSHLRVRALSWKDGWGWSFFWVEGHGWHDGFVAAVSAS